jgi:hypothetical protein
MKAGDSRLTASSIPISSDIARVISTPSLSTTPAEEPPKSDLWIFREGRREVSGSVLVRDFERRLTAKDDLLDCVIQAGELEAALADLKSQYSSLAAKLTDVLAYELCTGTRPADANPKWLLNQIQVPKSISISPPEGFTYYALHPSDFAKVAGRVPPLPITCAVIGIRSIGTTLSAIITAALKAAGRAASRITVRPTGHPYARNAEFSEEEAVWIRKQLSFSTQFLIVDEGPGRSGSTFLSVAEALCRAGVAANRITIIGSRPFDPGGLCAERAAERWRQFTYISTVPSVSTKFTDCIYIGGGDWRRLFFGDEQHWPESWTQMERLKFLSSDRRELLKFEGMGPIGKEVRERAFALTAAGFSPAVSDGGDGFLAYRMIDGKHLRNQDVSTSVLEQISHYCAFRVSEFSVREFCRSELETMLTFNVQQEFGRELKLNPEQLGGANPVLVDGRMQAFEWVASSTDQFLKTDAISHGDNHFFPGPCDIAWDLAGAAVEWQLSPEALEFLVNKFRQISGVDVSRQLSLYVLTYCVFRLGFCKMARSTVRGSSEESRLNTAYLHYRARAEHLLDSGVLDRLY